MKKIAKLASWVALCATVVPGVFYFAEWLDHQQVKLLALAGTVIWFIATPMWMGKELPVDAAEVEI